LRCHLSIPGAVYEDSGLCFSMRRIDRLGYPNLAVELGSWIPRNRRRTL
jgi:hypothetical protein